MPVLDHLPDLDDFVDYITSVMLYPTDENAREEFYFVHEIGKRVDSTPDDADVTVPKESLVRLLRSSSQLAINQRAEQAKIGGMMSGDLLGLVSTMSRCGIPEPSLRKAVWVLEDAYSRPPEGRSAIPHSSTSISKSWDDFRPVAHFWATFQLFQADPGRQGSDRPILTERNVWDFLGYAEEFRKFGESFMPDRQRAPGALLPADESWCVHESIELPVHEIPVESIPEWMNERLASYANRGLPD